MANKKSPRSPSISLDDAIAKAVKVYEKERRHAAPTDVVAQDIGYKSANNGAALGTLASLRYYGLLERPKEGHLAVSKEVETYLYTPDEEVKRELLRKWLKTPPVFLEIVEKYVDGLPSDATLRFDLIGQGFSPTAAEGVIPIFKKSADFADIYSKFSAPLARSTAQVFDVEPSDLVLDNEPTRREGKNEFTQKPMSAVTMSNDDSDRIPIRLTEGRKAWLIIPSPFYEADKNRIKAQIDLLLTDD
jgi:hypothetical protein